MTRNICAVALAFAAACSGGTSTPDGTTFPMNATTDSGSLHLVVSALPNPPVVGTDTLELTITSAADESPQDGLTVDVAPYMPSMGHGTSATTVVPEGGGKYLVTNVYLFMPGVWELKTTITGPLSDHAEPTFELP